MADARASGRHRTAQEVMAELDALMPWGGEAMGGVRYTMKAMLEDVNNCRLSSALMKVAQLGQEAINAYREIRRAHPELRDEEIRARVPFHSLVGDFLEDITLQLEDRCSCENAERPVAGG